MKMHGGSPGPTAGPGDAEAHGEGHARRDGHGHAHDHGHGHGGSNLKVAFLLNLAFTVLEVIGGLWTNSVAILSDAVHDLGDSLSLGTAWYFERLSRRGRTPQNTYGSVSYTHLTLPTNREV